MNKELKTYFTQYALENLYSIKVPNSKNKYHEFDNLEILCELLMLFLNFEVNESSLKRIPINFENGFNIIYELDIKELSGSIESLAANFEPFLKKIAYIKFNDLELWQGSNKKKGLKSCTLYELIEGGFNIESDDINLKYKTVQFPGTIVAKSGNSKTILDFVRSNLRNSVHNARTYNRVELAEYSNLVLSSYLIAINDNIEFLKEKFFIEYNYLRKISKSIEFIKINDNYVETLGKEVENNKNINSISNNDIDNLEIKDENDFIGIDSIVNISKEIDNFILIGEPGSGKSTSLKKIMYDNTVNLLQNEKSAKFPIFINASIYSKNNNFLNILKSEIAPISLEYLLGKYKIQVLIDGINEIDDEFKSFALKDLNYLLNSHKEISFIISTRKYGFINNLNIKIYELKSFNEIQINDFIQKAIGSKNDAEYLWKSIETNHAIFDIITNPLMLNMFLDVFQKENKKIPSNKAILYKLFIDKILEREQLNYNTKIKTKIDVLSYLAFWMRSNGFFKNLNLNKAKELIKNKLYEIDQSIGSIQIIDELIDNNLILEKEETIEFQHETIQEYFVALELKNQFHTFSELKINYAEDKWTDALIMCAQLLKNDQDIKILHQQLFVGQKNNVAKHINIFEESDINQNFQIGCKIAYNIKDTCPDIYKLTEDHLQNYISLWLLKYKKNKVLFKFENLVIAVANLSSFKVFTSFFLNINILEYLFHDEESKSEARDIFQNQTFEEKFKKITHLFSESLNNTSAFYKANNLISEFIEKIHNLNVSKSIKLNYKRFLQIILNDSSTNQLKEVFKSEKDKEILFFIGETDLAFFINNYKSIINLNKQKVINFLLKYHFKNPNIFEILTNLLYDEQTELDDKRYLITTLLRSNSFFHKTLDLLYKLKFTNDIFIHDESLKTQLNSYPIELLRQHGLDTLFIIPEIVEDKRNLGYLYSDEDFHYYENIEDLEFYGNNIYLKETKLNILRKEYENKVLEIKLYDYSVINNLVSDYKDNKILIFEYLEEGIQNFSNLKVRKIKKSKMKQGCILVYLDCVIPFYFDKLINKKISIHISDKYYCAIESINTYENKCVIGIDKKVNFDLNSILQIRNLKPNINFDKPYLYHKDILICNEIYLSYLTSKILDHDKQNFFKQLLLLNLNYKEGNIENNYGVVLNEPNDINIGYSVYSITNKKIVENHVFSSSIYNIKINDIVLIEKNIYITPLKINKYIENFYSSSYVSNFNIEKGEGFIYDNNLEKDYYFMAKYCDFTPKVGDKVKFIPGVNYSKRLNKNMPMAYDISIKEIEKRVAIVIKQLFIDDYNKDCLEYILSDENTNEELFTRIYASYNNNQINELKIGEKYFYADYITKQNIDQPKHQNRNKRITILKQFDY